MNITPKLGYAIIGVIASVTFPLILMFLTGFVSLDFSRLYSSDIKGPQSQVYALCNGSIALSEDPSDLLIDYVYHEGKVQQIWGLGVASIQSLILCFVPIPDRVFLLVVLMMLSFAVYWNVSRWVESGQGHRVVTAIIAVCSVFVFIFLPATVSLLRTRFLVYEETIYYSYLYSVLLFLCSWIIIESRKAAFFLGVLCGFAVIMRPTVLSYGIATLVILLWRTPSYRFKRFLIYGFCTMGIIAALLNWYRFGSPTEFGHTTNVSHDDVANTYQLKFDYAYKNESFVAANKELFGALFYATPTVRGAYLAHKFPLQSDTTRWRAFYNYTFNPWYLSFMVILCIVLWKCKKYGYKKEFILLQQQLVWVSVAAVSLWSFYLYSPSISSRYMVDFGAVFVILALLTLIQVGKQAFRSKMINIPIIGAIFCLWIISIQTDLASKPISDNHPSPFPLANKRLGFNDMSELSSVYHNGDFVKGKSLFNGTGWRTPDGVTGSSVILFFDKPRLIALKVEGECDYLTEVLQLRIDTDLVSYSSYNKEDSAHQEYTFHIPSKYSHDIWPVFFKMLPLEKATSTSDTCRLIKVENR